MKPIHEVLNKIRYSPRERPEDYVLFYYDRIERELKPLSMGEIRSIESGFLVLLREGREINIPLHRIKRVERKKEVVWERPA